MPVQTQEASDGYGGFEGNINDLVSPYHTLLFLVLYKAIYYHYLTEISKMYLVEVTIFGPCIRLTLNASPPSVTLRKKGFINTLNVDKQHDG